MTNKLVSIAVPVYNMEKYLDECIDSLLAQTHKQIEIILVNDGSTDNSGKICDKYAKKDKRVTVIHKKNEGQNFARRDGFKASKGEFWTSIDPDDYVAKNYVSLLLEAIIQTDADIASCAIHDIYQGEEHPKNPNIDESIYFQDTNPEKILSALVGQNRWGIHATIVMWDKLYRRELFDGYDWNRSNWRRSEEIYLNTAILPKVSKVAYVNANLIFHRIDGKYGELGQGFGEDLWYTPFGDLSIPAFWFRFNDEIDEILREYNYSDWADRNAHKAIWYMHYINISLQNNDFETAERFRPRALEGFQKNLINKHLSPKNKAKLIALKTGLNVYSRLRGSV